MATLDTEATTQLERLYRALAVFEALDPPEGIGVQVDAGMRTVPASLALFPGSDVDHQSVRRRLSLHEWVREPQWAWSKAVVFGVEVVLHDVRGAAA